VSHLWIKCLLNGDAVAHSLEWEWLINEQAAPQSYRSFDSLMETQWLVNAVLLSKGNLMAQ
jgi:hypothetical protein